MLCSAVVGGIDSRGKGKARDEETQAAAVECLVALSRPRVEQAPNVPLSAEDVLRKFVAHAQSQKFIPVLGQTVNSLIACTMSAHRPLQLASLRALFILLDGYVSEDFAPSMLPGVTSSMIRLALGTSSKGWANGDIIAEALAVMQVTVIKSIGDEACLRTGVVRDVTNIEDLVNLGEHTEGISETTNPFQTARTAAWLRATSSQLLIALNTITSLVTHPDAGALAALSTFSFSVLGSTSLTLPLVRPLLVSFLLKLSISSYPRVSEQSRESLESLLSPTSKIRHSLLDTFFQITKDNLSAIPRLLLSHSDEKVEHVAGIIEAIGALASSRRGHSAGLSAVSSAIGKLFGPMGGVEKWGWRILSVLEFEPPAAVLNSASLGLLILESPVASRASMPFPDLVLRHIATRSTQTALERMLIVLGAAAGEEAVFAVEWFASIGGNAASSRSIAALWCACRLLEGASGVRLVDVNATPSRPSRKMEKLARALARSMAEIWEDGEDLDAETPAGQPSFDVLDIVPDAEVEHQRGLVVLSQTMGVLKHGTSQSQSQSGHSQSRMHQPLLHKAIALHLLCISAGVLQAHFTPLLIHVLYPVLHSIVSPSSFSSTTGLAALDFIASSSSYASPANLLLSNFDYALDAVSRRLSREHLDIGAMKVLVLLVRLVGPEVVHRAADLVDECFARLDEYHGYEVIVDGLVEVLGEVVKAIERSEDAQVAREPDITAQQPLPSDSTRLDVFVEWYKNRHKPDDTEVDDTDYGPAPRRFWGPRVETTAENGTKDRDTDGPIDEEKTPTPVQSLTKQIVSRSIYFLTHRSPLIRARILNLLVSAVPVLPELALLQSIHHAWPLILNRFSDAEAFVVSAAAALVEALAMHIGSSMYRRIWDDVWPIVRRMLRGLEASDSQRALTRRGIEHAGPESVYANSFRLYCAIIKTMTASARHVQSDDSLVWEVMLAFRRFLHRENHALLQHLTVQLYKTVAENNEDAVWLVLVGTVGLPNTDLAFLCREDWDIEDNVKQILQ
jgi:hypothetical protein